MICILNLDSPSLSEYKQCGCNNCLLYLLKECSKTLDKLAESQGIHEPYFCKELRKALSTPQRKL